MLSPKEQHAEQAKRILARRKGEKYVAPVQDTSSQYDEMATKIVEKQKTENESQENANEPVEPEATDEAINWDEVTKAQIMEQLDDKNIPYPKKATKAQLIELIGG